MSRAEPRRAPAAVFAAALLLYLAARSSFWNFDGVACAIAVELSDFKHLVHGNHLAFGPLAWAFDRLWRAAGYAGPALLPLQTLCSLLGAAAAAAFARLLGRTGRSDAEAFLGGLALALSHAWWFWSLEAQVYPLGALFVVLAAAEALEERPRAWLVGLWHGAAFLGHAGHAMAALPLLYALRRGGPRALAEWAGAAAAVVLPAYALAAALAVRPASPEEWRVWLLGSAALTPDRSFRWHSAPVGQSLAGWARLTLDAFRAPGPWWGAILALAPLAAAARAARAAAPPARFWLIWLGSYAALYLTWEPDTLVYRITDLPALWALALMGLAAAPRELRLGALAAWCAAALAWNGARGVAPHRDPAANPDWADAAWAAARAPESAWLLAAGRGQVYVPYFAARRPLNPLYWADDAALAARLDALGAAGEALYATERALELSGRRDFFAARGLEVAAREGGRTLYRVRTAASPAAGASRN